MAFSKQAIGFYLEVDDRLTPALAKAEKGYKKFVESLERFNTKAYKSSSSGMGELSKLVKSLEKLPQKTGKSYDDALKRVKKKAQRAINQPINLVFTTKTVKALAKGVSEAIHAAISGSKFRLRATMPAKKLKMFDTGVSLRSAYSSIAQPPDYVGGLKVQKFAEGGTVAGSGGGDKVPAFLTPGEVVMPVKLVEFWKKTTDKASKGLTLFSSKFKDLFTNLKGTNKAAPKFDKHLGRWRDDMGKFVSKKNIKGVQDLQESIEDIGDDTKALTFFATLALASEGVKDLGSNVSGAFSEMEGGEAKSFVENMNELNQHLGMSREELREFKKASVEATSAGGTGLNRMGAALSALADAGITSQEALLALGADVANMATASNADVGALSALSYRLSDDYGLSAQQIAGTYNAVSTIAHKTAIDAATLIESMENQAKAMGPTLAGMSAESSQAILTNMAITSGALAENWGSAGTAMTDMMAEAIGGGDASGLLAMGMNVQEVQAAMESGNMAGLFNDISARVAQFDITTMEGKRGLMGLKEAMHFPGEISELAALGTNVDSINEKMVSLGVQTAGALDPTIDQQQTLVENADPMLTTFDRWSESFQGWMGNLNAFGVSGIEVLDFFSEFNVASLAAIGHLGVMAAKGIGGMLMKMPLLGKGLGAIGGKLGSVFGAKSPVAQMSGAGGGGAAAGGGIGGMLKGIGEGVSGFLKAMASGLTTFGAAMMGPGGLGLLALLAAAIAIGFAIKLAAPLFEMLGNVISKMIDGFVEVFKTLATLEVGQMMAIGPALILIGAGVGVLALSTGAMGLAMGAAAVGIGLFRLATGGKALKDGGIVGVVMELIGGFKPLAKQSKMLEMVNKVMGMLVDFMVDFAKLAAIIAGLSVGAMIAGAIDSVLGFFGVDSPMEQLAGQGREMVTTITSLVNDFAGAGAAMAQMPGVTGAMTHMMTFIRRFAGLQAMVSELPDRGVMENVANAVTDFFGADSPIERLSEDAGDIFRTMSRLTNQFAGLQMSAAGAAATFSGITSGELSQSNAQARVVGEQIDSVITAVLSRADESPLHTDLLENNRLLGTIAGLLRVRNQSLPIATAPAITSRSRGGDQFTQQVAEAEF
jgi:ElaB/YqjD/DUF883 family membrane-anchored ribosome-binding protein